MSKMIRGAIAGIAVLAVVLTFWQWKGYAQKKECRENALLYFKEQDYSKSIRYLEEGLDKKCFFASKIEHDMNCYLAESHYQLGEYDKAETIYDALIKKNPGEARYYQLKGRCAKEAWQLKKAVQVFNDGWKKTKQGEFLKEICDIYLEKGNEEKALAYAREGVRAGGESKQQFMYLEVIIYEKSQDYQKAYEAVEEYCSLFPEDEAAQKEKTFLSTRI